MKTYLYFLLTLILCLVEIELMAQATFKHAVYIGVDGMGTYGIPNAETPHMDTLIQNGVLLQGQAVLPTKSGPNWTSLLNGVDSDTHGVKTNSWRITDIQDSVFCGGEKGERIPTIFRAIRDQYPNANTALFHDWPNIRRYVERDVSTVQAGGKDEDITTFLTVSYLEKYQPMFSFIHLDHVDIAGHEAGHKTPIYYQAVEKADSLIGEIIAATKRAGMYESTLFVIISDHGGIGKSHGGDTPEETSIPILISGGRAKVKADSRDIRSFDIPPTILKALGVNIPSCWEGKPLPMVYDVDK